MTASSPPCSYSSLAKASSNNTYEACLYNFTKRINLTILTILPALVPTLDALPALANEAAELAPVDSPLANKIYENHPISSKRDNVETISKTKKKLNRYPSFAILDITISKLKANMAIILNTQK